MVEVMDVEETPDADVLNMYQTNARLADRHKKTILPIGLKQKNNQLDMASVGNFK